MTKGDPIYLKSPNHGCGRRFHGFFVKDRLTEPPACDIRLGLDERESPIWLVLASEIELCSVVDEREAADKEAERQKRQMAKLQPVIDAWNAGARKWTEIAKAADCAPETAKARVIEAKGKGLIT